MAKLAQVKIFLAKLVHTSLKRTHSGKSFKSLWVEKLRVVKFHPDIQKFRVVESERRKEGELYPRNPRKLPRPSVLPCVSSRARF